ncbi:MAG: type II toxin-antitoxin system HicA family toxin [Syntrophales bacterium LBB04]|nr:type II toxin-antitoxin system HicA family toxin [Syntrophales bacterium LBB04]
MSRNDFLRKRTDLIRYLEKRVCVFFREGGSHTVFVNRREKKVSTIPRHREIDENLCLRICKDLGIPKP